MDNLLILHASQIATPTGATLKHGTAMSDITEYADGAIYIENQLIKQVGTTDDVMRYLQQQQITAIKTTINAAGKTVIPGFIDSHTHLVFGGFRLAEFCQRLSGKTYLELMAQGGGIQNTVAATHAASFAELYASGAARLTEMLQQGVTTAEVKSGYGLDQPTETKQLQVIRELGLTHQVDVVATYLGAHAIPLDYKNNPDAYIDWIISTMLPQVKAQHLAEFVDIFCEKDVFTLAQSRKLLGAAQAAGFKTKIHADEIEDLGGAQLAAELGAASADHLLTISDAEIEALSQSDTVAGVLPCTAFSLQETYAPARKMIDNGVGVALGSDYNPGSSFTCSMPLLIALAGIQMQMSMAEILTALTLNAAVSINRQATIGTLEIGKKADLQILKYPDYRYLLYNTGLNIVDQVIKNGEVVVDNTK